MAQKTFKKVSSAWKEIIEVWIKISGTWQGGVIPYRKISGEWKACFDDGFNEDWDGYISWAFDYEDSGTFHFIAHNDSLVKDGQSSIMYWETRDVNDDVIESGNVSSGSLDATESSYPTDAVSSGYVSIWGKTGTSQYNQLY